MSTVTESLFIDVDGGPQGQRFVRCLRPSGMPVKACVVHVPPLAEEMNKSRRMVAQQAGLLAEKGLLVLHADLFGCGDSAGDFGEATWQRWLADVLGLCRRAAEMAPGVPLWLWGLRSGCLLACEAAGRLDVHPALLFWQPTLNGDQVLQQFLRLRAAGEMLSQGDKGVVERLRKQLASGSAVDVAGYTLHPELCSGLQSARLRPAPQAPRVVWLEVSPRSESGWSPATRIALKSWQDAGCEIEAELVAGPPFWQTTEIEDAPDLWRATLAGLVSARTAESSGNRIA